MNGSHLFSKLKLFFALSRTQHGLLDIAAPGLAALLWLHHFPEPSIILLGLLTAFAGYTAIYALNDLAGVSRDLQKIEAINQNPQFFSSYLDAQLIRHPITQGQLSFKAGLSWCCFWLLVAAVGAYLLNPFSLVILMIGAVLEFLYCKLLTISMLRFLISGVVKTCGPIAAIVVVTQPSLIPLSVFFIWIFMWEIGGQNIPADWSDIHEDTQIQAKTIPVKLGVHYSASMILIALSIATMANVWLLFQFHYPIVSILIALVINYYLLLQPAYRLYTSHHHTDAMKLFTRASYYPLALLILIALTLFTH